MITHLNSDLALTQEHDTVKQYIRNEGHELLWRLLQAHLELRASQENRQDNIINIQDNPGEFIWRC